MTVAQTYREQRPAARLRHHLIAREADGLRYNPWVTGGGIEPVGALMSLRDPAYRASQAAANGSG